jgi:hypothetical protein
VHSSATSGASGDCPSRHARASGAARPHALRNSSNGVSRLMATGVLGKVRRMGRMSMIRRRSIVESSAPFNRGGGCPASESRRAASAGTEPRGCDLYERGRREESRSESVRDFLACVSLAREDRPSPRAGPARVAPGGRRGEVGRVAAGGGPGGRGGGPDRRERSPGADI